jgi:hypothetical protein
MSDLKQVAAELKRLNDRAEAERRYENSPMRAALRELIQKKNSNLRDAQSHKERARRSSRKSDEQRDHETAIRDIIKDFPKMRGLDYCRLVDERTAIPELWRADGCPATYEKAYRDVDWRKRIQDEKTRVTSGNGL